MSSPEEKKTIVELLETTLSLSDKIASRMGKQNYLRFIKSYNTWKDLIKKHYKDTRNFDGRYSLIFLENCIGLIEEYHYLAIANYGEVTKDNPELQTKLAAGVQGIMMSKIKEQMEIVPVQYSEISEKTSFDALNQALEIFLSKKGWKPDKYDPRGFIYISMIIYLLDALAFAKLYYFKSLKYHILQQSKSFEENKDYWEQFYLLVQKPIKPIFLEEWEKELLLEKEIYRTDKQKGSVKKGEG